jgi:hypothetical protein
LQDGAVLNRKETLVARTFQAIALTRIVDGAGKMRTFLAIGYVFVFCGADQNTTVFSRRIRE